jgi:hypothetical protein
MSQRPLPRQIPYCHHEARHLRRVAVQRRRDAILSAALALVGILVVAIVVIIARGPVR